jgi:uncharacterized protein YbaP (TraB family)
MKFNLILSMVIMTLSVFSAKAQELAKIPVWAWKVTGGERDVYLLAELHDISGNFGLKVDYQMGEKIVQLSSEVWVESPQDSISGIESYPQLSKVLKDSTWRNVLKVAHDSIQIIAANSNAIKRDALEKDLVDSLNNSHPLEAYNSLSILQNLLHRKAFPLQRLPYVGLRKYLTDKKNENTLKFMEIEDKQAVARAWLKNCEFKDTESLINSALRGIENNYFRMDEIQTIFLTRSSDLGQLEAVIASEESGQVLKKCTINPRNAAWLPFIKKAASTPGKPVTFLLGLEHFPGDQGLIQMLREEGYSDIKRIYNLE